MIEQSSTYSQLSKVFELKTQTEEKLAEDIKSAPNYIVIYIFNGTLQRSGVGHIALWDGNSYYSYGLSKCAEWIEECASLVDSQEKAIRDNKIWAYGPCKKIILPMNSYLAKNYHTIRSNIETRWKSNEYTIYNQNCAHMVQEYMTQARYTIPIRDCSVFPLYPSEVGNNAEKIGQAITNKIIADILSQPEIASHQKSFFNLLNVLLARPLLNDLQKSELRDAMKDGASDQERFCNLIKVLAHHHYNMPFAYEMSEADIFYENMFRAVLEMQKTPSEFENKPQIYKTGVLNYPIGMVRAILGVLAVGIAFIPGTLIYSLCKLYVAVTKQSEEPPEPTYKLS